MPMMAINAKLYYNTGTYGTPTWTEITNVSDVKLGINFDRVDVATRASIIKKTGKALADVPLNFKIKQHLTNAQFLAVWAALISQTAVLDLLVLNSTNATNGARGVRGEFFLFSADDDQALGNGLFYDVNAAPADTDNAFATAVVASGAPVFTAA